MACISAAVVVLLLNYLVSSEGALSPPNNISVELFDFRTLVRWLPGLGNPTGTRYSLEFIDIAHYPEWNPSPACTNITTMQCYLTLSDLYREYYVRVMAEWKAERSTWTALERSFQPFSINRLSAPDLNVSFDQHSIWINLSHRVQSFMDVPQLRFSVDLFQMDSNSKAQKHITQNKTQRSSHFTRLPPGRYCVNASAFYTEMFTHNHNATKCVLLEPCQTGGTIWAWAIHVCVFLLLALPASALLSVAYCKMGPRVKTRCIPKVLIFIEGTGRFLTLIPEEPRAVPVSIADKPALEEIDDYESQGYYLRRHVVSWSVEDLEDARSTQMAHEDLAGLYRTAAIMEEPGEDMSLEERPDEHEPTCRNFCFSNSLEDRQPTFGMVELGKLLSSQVDSITEHQVQSGSSCSYLGENETDSMNSDSYLENGYMPRPDPRWMLEVHK